MMIRMDERERRIAANEAIFRVLNAERDKLTEPAATSMVCECGDLSCVERIRLSHEDYREVRSASGTFAVVHGHAKAEIEEVVRRGSGYDVVRKKPGAAEIAQEVLERL